MDVLKRISLKNAVKNQYVNGILVEGNYYFLVPSINKVYIYNLELSDFYDIETEEKYNSITHNKTDNIFYVSKEIDCNNIYITNLDLKEIGLVKLSIPEKYIQKINDIYYSDARKRIYITTDNIIYSVTYDGYFIKEEYNLNDMGTTVNTTIVRDLDGKSYPITTLGPIPNTAFTCAYELNNSLYIGYAKEKASYLIKISLDGDMVENNYIDNNSKINSIINVSNGINLLMLNNNRYNYIYLINNDGNCNFEEYRNMILEVVAKVSSTVSQVLNSESEKIYKSINNANNISEIIENSGNIKKTVEDTISVEQMLLTKLGYNSKENNL